FAGAKVGRGSVQHVEGFGNAILTLTEEYALAVNGGVNTRSDSVIRLLFVVDPIVNRMVLMFGFLRVLGGLGEADQAIGIEIAVKHQDRRFRRSCSSIERGPMKLCAHVHAGDGLKRLQL